jgi:hypothetical protein
MDLTPFVLNVSLNTLKQRPMTQLIVEHAKQSRVELGGA